MCLCVITVAHFIEKTMNIFEMSLKYDLVSFDLLESIFANIIFGNDMFDSHFVCFKTFAQTLVNSYCKCAYVIANVPMLL